MKGGGYALYSPPLPLVHCGDSVLVVGLATSPWAGTITPCPRAIIHDYRA
jgi:hypothetical protein